MKKEILVVAYLEADFTTFFENSSIFVIAGIRFVVITITSNK